MFTLHIEKCKQRRNKDPQQKHSAVDWTVPHPARRTGSISPCWVYEWEKSLKKEAVVWYSFFFPGSSSHSSPQMQMECHRPPLVHLLRLSVKSLSLRSSKIYDEHRGLPLDAEKSHTQGLTQSSRCFPPDLLMWICTPVLQSFPSLVQAQSSLALSPSLSLRLFSSQNPSHCWAPASPMCVYVYVCVCTRERAWEKDRQKENEWESVGGGQRGLILNTLSPGFTTENHSLQSTIWLHSHR